MGIRMRKPLILAIATSLIAGGSAWFFWPANEVDIKRVDSSSIVTIAKDDSPTVYTLSAAIDEIAWGPNSKTLTLHTKSTDENPRNRRRQLLEFTLATEQLREFFSTKESVNGLVLSGDQEALIGQWRTGPNNVCQVLTIDRRSGHQIERFDGAALNGLGVAFMSDPVALTSSPDGRFIAVGTKLVDNGTLVGSHIGGEICLWNRGTKSVHWNSRTAHADIVYAVAFSPDSKTLASAGLDKLIRLWDVETGELMQTYVGAAWDGVNSIAFSPNGKFLASGGVGAEDGGAVRIWDVKSGKMLHRFAPFRARSNVRLVFSPDGQLFATGLKKEDEKNQFQVHAWNVETGAHIGLLAEGAGAARAIAVSSDGRQLALGTYEGSLLIFDLK